MIVAKDRTGQFRKGDKTFYGEGGDDFLAGGAGSDHLYGGIGKDTLQGNTGNDRLEGGEGDDTYLYTVGDGDDVIKEIGGNNVLVLLGEITEKDVKLRKQGDHLYILIATGEGKKAGDIKIEDYFASEKHQIEKLWIANKEYHMRALLKRSATENGFHQDWPVALSDLLDHADRWLSGITQAMSAFHQPHVVNTVFGRQDMGSVFGLPLSFVELTP
ncbi:calcium-binding protein [Candidatus Williamhamiltonella defendens]|uniref:calcium-binding protein n=1 Tax=Candidatus Williamhamiltonella defendens TaxID=138072 RepID=UPI0011D0F77A|nr:calcium-binding protein [Candidatus Hamiltonella defensa]